jgi:hypothetical protein
MSFRLPFSARLLVAVCGLVSLNTASLAQDPLATQVKTILENRCSDCHANGSAEGEIDYVLNRNRLVQRGMVIARNATGSKLYRQVKTGNMPPGR